MRPIFNSIFVFCQFLLIFIPAWPSWLSPSSSRPINDFIRQHSSNCRTEKFSFYSAFSFMMPPRNRFVLLRIEALKITVVTACCVYFIFRFPFNWNYIDFPFFFSSRRGFPLYIDGSNQLSIILVFVLVTSEKRSEAIQKTHSWDHLQRMLSRCSWSPWRLACAVHCRATVHTDFGGEGHSADRLVSRSRVIACLRCVSRWFKSTKSATRRSGWLWERRRWVMELYRHGIMRVL